MNYELAKELKDAGFPQPTASYQGTYKWFPIGFTDREFLEFSDEQKKSMSFYIPTLSELIEACGDSFGSLKRNDGGWLVIPYDWSSGITMQNSSTPEEAVARLWLALNKEKPL